MILCGRNRTLCEGYRDVDGTTECRAAGRTLDSHHADAAVAGACVLSEAQRTLGRGRVRSVGRRPLPAVLRGEDGSARDSARRLLSHAAGRVL